MGELSFQLLTHRIRLSFTTPEAGDVLRGLVVNAAHPHPPSLELHYRITMDEDGFRVALDGGDGAAGLSGDQLAQWVHASVYYTLHHSRPPHLRLHAACADPGGRRVLFVGRKRAGKTTLMLRLLRDGVPVRGDELVMLEADGTALPLPRRFHVRPGSFPLCPELADVQAAAPRLRLPGGGTAYALAPDELGHAWSIAPAPVDALVFLKPNHGGRSSLVHLPPESAARRLAKQISLPEFSPHWVEGLSRLVDCRRVYLLYNGDLDQSSAMLRNEFPL